MNITDFKGVLNKSKAKVESVENPYGDYYVIKLVPQDQLKWIPGEHAIYTLPDKEIFGKKWRAFSVASIDKEGMLVIGTRIGKTASSFKDNLIHMKKGETVNVRGPFGWFKLREDNRPIVLIASGVGVTPIMALLKALEEDQRRDVHIIYASSDYYLFEEDIEKIVDNNPAMNLYKTKGSKATQEKIKEIAEKVGDEGIYYISGNTRVIKSIKDTLKEKGISKKNMINDPFLGY